MENDQVRLSNAETKEILIDSAAKGVLVDLYVPRKCSAISAFHREILVG